jgi:hypothetical protein
MQQFSHLATERCDGCDHRERGIPVRVGGCHDYRVHINGLIAQNIAMRLSYEALAASAKQLMADADARLLGRRPSYARKPIRFGTRSDIADCE